MLMDTLGIALPPCLAIGALSGGLPFAEITQIFGPDRQASRKGIDRTPKFAHHGVNIRSAALAALNLQSGHTGRHQFGDKSRNIEAGRILEQMPFEIPGYKAPFADRGIRPGGSRVYLVNRVVTE